MQMINLYKKKKKKKESLSTCLIACLKASYIYENYFVERWVLRTRRWAGLVFLSINLISFKHSQNYHFKNKIKMRKREGVV